jgi:hypothetical protein
MMASAGRYTAPDQHAAAEGLLLHHLEAALWRNQQQRDFAPAALPRRKVAAALQAHACALCVVNNVRWPPGPCLLMKLFIQVHPHHCIGGGRLEVAVRVMLSLLQLVMASALTGAGQQVLPVCCGSLHTVACLRMVAVWISCL